MTTQTTTLRAYHGDPAIKERYLARVRAHRAADQIIHGTYWEDGRGCAVGCTLHSSDPGAYERELGVPRAIARLEDRLFEGMTNGVALDFPVRFLEAIPVGADLSLVTPRFLHWLLVDERDGVLQYARPDGAAAIRSVAALYEHLLAGEAVSEWEWKDAASADAYAAAYAADAAAYAAAYAADAAAYAAAYAADAAARWREKRSQAYERMAEKLLALLTEAPIPTGGVS